MLLGKLPVTGRSTVWSRIGQGPGHFFSRL